MCKIKINQQFLRQKSVIASSGLLCPVVGICAYARGLVSVDKLACDGHLQCSVIANFGAGNASACVDCVVHFALVHYNTVLHLVNANEKSLLGGTVIVIQIAVNLTCGLFADDVAVVIHQRAHRLASLLNEPYSL